MKRIFQQQSGATIIEFALVAPVLFLLMFAIIEFGRIGFTQSVVETVTAQAAREASIGKALTNPDGTKDRVGYIEKYIKDKLTNTLDVGRLVISAAPVSASGGGVTAQPDICLTVNPPRIGGDCPKTPGSDGKVIYEDVNGNGKYDAGVQGANLGNEGAIVEVQVSYPWLVTTPLVKQFFGKNGVLKLTSSVVVKNEPFGN